MKNFSCRQQLEEELVNLNNKVRQLESQLQSMTESHRKLLKEAQEAHLKQLEEAQEGHLKQFEEIGGSTK